MKISFLLSVFFFSFFTTSCDKEEPDPVAAIDISNITLAESFSIGQMAEVNVTITKPTPCHIIEEKALTISGRIYSYNFRLIDKAEICIQVTQEETVTVDFEPAEAGEHTLNFFINGDLLETRTVTVTE
ncbi:hypothetical protein LZ575_13705 [Antarcticibacterium sp. 1MA-6-2]|uniref:hypothetical protein n=1 Tax=Antarcticibacterium sp. 1MA-6-2 TaxID=2908210 RepID=UPI001F2D2940|nr:hypothetical protein [Antarcticibacterium sp. 1MA-6-2]UJH89999.1 hypothetical protein LZ575_13705 [Antarcticibacterium sp. 1MA-6-2]